MDKQKMLIIIGGPTASGKTSLAIELAQQFDTEIISADSRQFYQEMSIGTAKPTAEELSQATHHLVGHLSIHEEYSAGQFEIDAMEKIMDCFSRSNFAIVVGGSGLFLKAITEGLDDFPEVDPEIRTALNVAYERDGLAPLLKELAEKDAEYLNQVDQSNPRRIIRALEIIRSTGKTASSFRKGKNKERPFECIYLQPHWNREALYARIDQRVELMFEQGLESEVQALRAHQDLTSLQTVGYQELFDYFDGKITLEVAKGLIQQHSRRYAKRQLTWARQRGEWILLAQPFFQSATSYLNWYQQGWRFKIRPLKSQKPLGHAEEKFQRIECNREGHAVFLLLSKRPKIAQAYFEFSAETPEDLQQFLFGQLLMRADGLGLFVWMKKEAVHLTKGKAMSEVQGGHFVFEEWITDKSELIRFKLD